LKVVSLERFDTARLLAGIRRTRLRGFGGARPYAAADLRVAAVDPATLAPAQHYVLRAGVERAVEVRAALLDLGVDSFALDGGAWFRTADDPDEVVTIIPPVVEASREPDGAVVPLINDGIHRIFAARAAGLPITVVLATGVPAEYPYYAYPLRGGWSEVVELDELPDGFQKKRYRQPDGYHALFRDFSAVFPGVQKRRKRSNPGHLRA
jgi:hypothetical protein